MSMQRKEVTSKLYSAGGPRLEVVSNTRGASMTRQEFLDECDVNVIMERYERTLVLPVPVGDVQPRYFDAVGVPDLQEAMQIMMDANEAFMSLPAKVRREFDNDAIKFVEFAGKAENIERMREWGLAPYPEPEAAPMRVEVVEKKSVEKPAATQ